MQRRDARARKASSKRMATFLETPLMADPNDGDTYSEAETDARREAALKRMLATPPRPHMSLGEERRERAEARPRSQKQADEEH